MAVTGHHARLGTRLPAKLCRGRYFKRLNSISFQGTTPHGPRRADFPQQVLQTQLTASGLGCRSEGATEDTDEGEHCIDATSASPPTPSAIERVAVERNQKRAEVSLSEKDAEDAVVHSRSQLASAEKNALGTEMAMLLSSLITTLPEALRDALRLSTVQELAPAEIAAVLGTSEATVRWRLFPTRQILNEKLSAL